VHILAEFVETPSVGLATTHWQRRFDFPAPAADVVSMLVWRLVAPNVECALATGPRRALPFSLRGQPVVSARAVAQPLAVFHRFEPAHGRHGLLRVVESGVIPEWWRRMAGGFEKRPVLLVAYRIDAKLETVDPDAMHRPLFIAPPVTAHEEIPGRDRRALRLGKPRH